VAGAGQQLEPGTRDGGGARDLIRGGGEVTMPAVAKSALVSEATAYRYFPDLASLLNEALAGVWPSPETALEPVARSTDPVERIGYATEALLHRSVRTVLRGGDRQRRAHRPGPHRGRDRKNRFAAARV
jgi:AcrR family transcriptional regulator